MTAREYLRWLFLEESVKKPQTPRKELNGDFVYPCQYLPLPHINATAQITEPLWPVW